MTLASSNADADARASGRVRSARGRLRSLGSVVLAGAIVALGIVGSLSMPASAAAPPPPLDACLAQGSFDISDKDCLSLHRPQGGLANGGIAGVEQHVTTWGGQVSVTSSARPPQPLGTAVVCGDLGCVGYQMAWRGSGDGSYQVVSGCTGVDLTCTIRYWPRYLGDRGEGWGVLYGQLYYGRTPMGDGTAYALYAPPRAYRLHLPPRDVRGASLSIGPGQVAYAVRSGASVRASDCVDPQWADGDARFQLDLPVPDCVQLTRNGLGDMAAITYAGFLPVDSGRWTIVGAPLGEAGAPLTTRPSAYRPLAVSMGHDDVLVPIVEERRPKVTLQLDPDAGTMALGTVQDIRVTVGTNGGDGGSIAGLVFRDPAILALEATDTVPLEVIDVLEGAPTAPFELRNGERQVFTVRVRAVGVGTAGYGAAIAGMNDLGITTEDERADRISVVAGTGGGDGTGMGIEPPLLVKASSVGQAGSVRGTVSGAPGASVQVTLWTSAPRARGECTRRVTGAGVGRLGSTEVILDDTGSGTFIIEGPATEGDMAYGIAAVGAMASDVSECRRIGGPVPIVSIAGGEFREGTGADPTTVELVVSLDDPADTPVSVRVRTHDGTARAPKDYIALDERVTIPAGATETTVLLRLVADDAKETDEELTVTLTEPDGAIVDEGGTATVVILDDDATTKATDIRGTWTGKNGDTKITVRILTEDPATGAVTGTWTAGPLDYTVTGTIKGDRLDLAVKNRDGTARVTGRIKQRNGTLTVTLSAKKGQGPEGSVTLTRR